MVKPQSSEAYKIAATGALGVHGAQRGPVSITQVTEFGQIYTLTELAELTAVSVANSLAESTPPSRLLVCGGGVHNAFLMRRLAAALPDAVVESTARYGADPDWVEALLFAWLARERLNQSALDTRTITGARKPVLLGDIHEP